MLASLANDHLTKVAVARDDNTIFLDCQGQNSAVREPCWIVGRDSRNGVALRPKMRDYARVGTLIE